MSCIITRTRGVYTKNGRPASDADQTRAKKLGIPPAYTDVCDAWSQAIHVQKVLYLK